MQGIGAQGWEGGVGSLERGAELAELGEAGGLAGAGDVLGFAVEPEGVGGEGGGGGGGGEGAQVGLGEGYAEGRVGGEIEGGVALAPVSGVVSCWDSEKRGGRYLMTAMFTGAVVVAE